MPWHVNPDDRRCPSSQPHAVVQSDTGELVGCHATRKAAENQIAALHASEYNTSQEGEPQEAEENAAGLWQVSYNDQRCPSTKPHAVIRSDTGEIGGCNKSRKAAERQATAMSNKRTAAQTKEPAQDLKANPRRGEVRKAIAAHDTDVTDPSGESDCAGYRSKAPNDRSVLRYIHAVERTGEGFDPDEKRSYALPHHSGEGAPADLACVRNALARLPQTEGLSEDEREGARRHLERHLNKQEQDTAPAGESRSGIEIDPDNTTIRVADEQVALSSFVRELDEMRRNHETSTPVQLHHVQVRASRAQNDPYTITGYASVVDREYELVPGVRERISSRAFANVLARDPDTHALWEHDTRAVLGRTRSKTLDLQLDSHGLRFWARPPDTSYARDLRTLMERGDVDQASFAFTVPDGGDEWRMHEEDGESVIVRTVTDMDHLFDVTVAAKGANPLTDSSVGRAAVRAAAGVSPMRASSRSVGATPPNSGGDSADASSPQPERLADEETNDRAEYLQARIAEWQVALRRRKRKIERFR